MCEGHTWSDIRNSFEDRPSDESWAGSLQIGLSGLAPPPLGVFVPAVERGESVHMRNASDRLKKQMVGVCVGRSDASRKHLFPSGRRWIILRVWSVGSKHRPSTWDQQSSAQGAMPRTLLLQGACMARPRPSLGWGAMYALQPKGKAYNMKKLHIIGLAVIAVFAFSAAVTTSAFALESVILVNAVKPTAAVTVTSASSGKVLLEDMGTLAARVECEGVTNEETLEAGGKNIVIKKVTFTKACTTPAKAEKLNGTEEANACTSVDAGESVSALHLPWLAEVVLSAGVFLTSLVAAAGGGAPGYKVECNTALGLVTDECSTEKGTTTLTNNAGGTITAAFPAAPVEAEFANCTIGGNLQGLVTGSIIFTEPKGLPLATSEG
jgi:hypothetical protein